MRTAFVETLSELAEHDPRVTLMVGDLGFGVVQEFAERFPAQFINAGVAEQNMTGMAAGLAHSGRIVFTYSIANFPTLRPLEQIRNDVCYHRANVIVVSVGGGFAYGALGMSHHATEDLAIMRSLPGLTVVAPGDPVETRALTTQLAAGVGPAYLRLGRAGEPTVLPNNSDVRIGQAVVAREGDEIAILSTGGMLATAVAAADSLALLHGLRARVLSFHTINPLDAAAVLRAAHETAGVITIEEHSLNGGLGGAVAEVLCEADLPSLRMKRLGIPPNGALHEIGSQEHLLKKVGLDVDSVTKTVINCHRLWSADGVDKIAA